MPGGCLNPYGCEWDIGYLWRWMNWIGRADVLVLAILFAYSVAVPLGVSWRCCLARRSREIDRPGRGEIVADLRTVTSSLKSIAFAAPYLGLAGACFGIMGIFRGFVMEMHAVRAMMAAILAAALVTSAAGILVAVPATCFYNYLCTLIELLEGDVLNESIDRRLPLRKRFSEFPAFALIAVPTFAMAVAAFMSFASFHEPKGFGIEVLPARCDYEGDDRVIVLRLSDAGELFINQTQEDWNSLSEVLSNIYSTRVPRTLYLLAEDGVPFQTVADAIDIVENANVEPHQAVRTGANKLDITVRLITPKTMNTSCVLEPVAIGSSHHASR